MQWNHPQKSKSIHSQHTFDAAKSIIYDIRLIVGICFEGDLILFKIPHTKPPRSPQSHPSKPRQGILSSFYSLLNWIPA